MVTKIWLVRHGEVNNPGDIVYGKLPGFVMAETGRQQIREAAEKLKREKIAKIFTSPQPRTRQAAEILGERLRVEIQEDKRLDEINSPLAGKITFKELREGNISGYDPKFTAEGGETEIEVAARMEEFVQEKSRKWRGRAIVAMSHGDPIWFLVAKIKNLPLTYRQLRTQLAYPELASVTQVVAEVGDVVKLSCD